MTAPHGLTALVVDYGGVLTNSIPEVFGAWVAADGLAPEDVRAVLGDLLTADPTAGADDSLHGLERGELDVSEFERRLAVRLRRADGGAVEATGLLRRAFSGMRVEPRMTAAVARAREAGVRTALLSNSWSLDYDRAGWEEMFDEVVISGEVGLRKPEPEIFALTAERLRVPADGCVFVDDLAANVHGAVAAGMVGVHHTDVDRTLEELRILLGVDLAGH